MSSEKPKKHAVMTRLNTAEYEALKYRAKIGRRSLGEQLVFEALYSVRVIAELELRLKSATTSKEPTHGS